MIVAHGTLLLGMALSAQLQMIESGPLSEVNRLTIEGYIMTEKHTKLSTESQVECSYSETEVSYENTTDQVTLAGTLTVPDRKGACPAVILIAGYGPQDRNATGMRHKYFSVLAGQKTAAGKNFS